MTEFTPQERHQNRKKLKQRVVFFFLSAAVASTSAFLLWLTDPSGAWENALLFVLGLSSYLVIVLPIVVFLRWRVNRHF